MTKHVVMYHNYKLFKRFFKLRWKFGYEKNRLSITDSLSFK